MEQIKKEIGPLASKFTEQDLQQFLDVEHGDVLKTKQRMLNYSELKVKYPKLIGVYSEAMLRKLLLDTGTLQLAVGERDLLYVVHVHKGLVDDMTWTELCQSALAIGELLQLAYPERSMTLLLITKQLSE